MTAPRPVRVLVRILASALLAVGFVTAAPVGAVPGAGSVLAADGLAPWTGEVSLYRAGTFTTQATWLWCTAADVQIARNIVYHETDHSSASQGRYFDWMRARNRYDIPLSGGVDAAGWAAGMARFVDARYQLVASATFDDALRAAVTNLRLTGLPVALAVSHGNHGWLLTGFAATADPAATAEFTVTSVRVVGPLYGRQSRNGYDMKPSTRLTVSQLRTFFTPWRYAPLAMTWDGTYVSIQPVPSAAPASTAPTPAPTPEPTMAASATSSAPTSVPAAVADGSPGGDASIALTSSARPTSAGAPWAATLALGTILVVLAGLLVALGPRRFGRRR